ncbi:hypothetical protein [Propionivibrio sp.]|uniref:hypothetical protein n=1 Tax=Propionivibrio sp. TaxID=2212460 RepID=UPI003BF2C442
MTSPNSLFNEESGNHPLPTDEREIAAVLCAALRCHEEHPYFSERYGERGEAFIRSDGGYLATLADHPQSYVNDQVTWLAGVLANRGMPRWPMEAHLDFLCDELNAAVPARAPDYLKLRHAAQLLREQRQARIAQADFDALVAAFESASGGCLKGAGGLVVAAVCDECCGLPEAVPSLIGWLSDPDRFPPQWCAAVTDTLARASAVADQKRGG